MTDDQPDLFTLTRSTDPITSREAVASISDRITAIQAVVLEWAKMRPFGLGFTDRELVMDIAGLVHSPSTLRTRRSELTAKGLIRHKLGPDSLPLYRTHGTSKRRHIVWEAVPT